MPTPRSTPLWLALTAFAIGLAGAAAAILFAVRISSSNATISRLESENRVLRGSETKLQQDLDALSKQLGFAPPPAETHLQAPRTPDDTAARLDEVRLLSQLRNELAAARTFLDDLQFRNRQLEAKIGKLSDDNSSLSAGQGELKERLDYANRVIQAMQTEIKGKDQRVMSLELANRSLRAEKQAALDKVKSFEQPSRDLEEIYRRREVHLTNILRLYRDLTEQYRTLAIRMDNPRESNLANPSVLSQIQSAISLVEEDLRQLSNLNAQAQLVHKKMKKP